MSTLQHVVKTTGKKWWAAEPNSMGAAVAYFTLFAIAPLFLIITSAISLFISPNFVDERLAAYLIRTAGPNVADLMLYVITRFNETHTSVLAGVIGLVTIIVGAQGMLSQLQKVINKIWGRPQNKPPVHIYIREKILAVAMIVLLIVVFTLSFSLSALSRYLLADTAAFEVVTILISFVLISVVCMIAFRYMPHHYVRGRAAIIGGLTTGLLFLIGRFSLNIYVTFSLTASSFGTAGTIIALLISLYYFAQIFILGAALTYTISERFKATY